MSIHAKDTELEFEWMIPPQATVPGAHESDTFVTDHISTVHGIQISPDGLKLFLVHNTTPTLYSYTFATAWDLSTVTYDSKQWGLTGLRTVLFKPDGFGMIAANSTLNRLEYYTMSTAWDISTLSTMVASFSFSSQFTANVEGMDISADGKNIIIQSYLSPSSNLWSYSLGTAWDLTTMTYDSQTFQPTFPTHGSIKVDMQVGNSGTSIYLMDGTGTKGMYEFSLSTAWDLSTIAYVGKIDKYHNTVTNACTAFYVNADEDFFYDDGENGSPNATLHRYTADDGPPAKSAYDIMLELPDRTVTYTDDGLLTHTAPTETTQGNATYKFTPTTVGRHRIGLMIGGSEAFTVKAVREIFVVDPPTHVLSGVAGTLLHGPEVLPDVAP
jgi:hypothetical protein